MLVSLVVLCARFTSGLFELSPSLDGLSRPPTNLDHPGLLHSFPGAIICHEFILYCCGVHVCTGLAWDEVRQGGCEEGEPCDMVVRVSGGRNPFGCRFRRGAASDAASALGTDTIGAVSKGANTSQNGRHCVPQMRQQVGRGVQGCL